MKNRGQQWGAWLQRKHELDAKPPLMGDGVLIATRLREDVVRVLADALGELAMTLATGPTCFVYRCSSGLVISANAPPALAEHVARRLSAPMALVRLEQMEVTPIMRISREGVRMYVPMERPSAAA